MDYKKKLKQRLHYGVICIVLGVIMIIGVTATKSENEYISAFGFAVAMVGVARIIQYLKITKNEDSRIGLRFLQNLKYKCYNFVERGIHYEQARIWS